MLLKTKDRLFLLKLIKELSIPDPATLEKIVLSLQLILLDEHLSRVYSYQFFKSRLGFSEKELFSDLRDLHRAELIGYAPDKEEMLFITPEGENFLEDFSNLLEDTHVKNFDIALKIFKDKLSNDPDLYIKKSPVILATSVGKSIFA